MAHGHDGRGIVGGGQVVQALQDDSHSVTREFCRRRMEAEALAESHLPCLGRSF